MLATKKSRSVKEHIDDCLASISCDFKKYLGKERIQYMFVPYLYSALNKNAFLTFFATHATQQLVNEENQMTMMVSGIHVNPQFWKTSLQKHNLKQMGCSFSVFLCPYVFPDIMFAHPWPCANQVDNCPFDVNVTCTYDTNAQRQLLECHYIICVRPVSKHSIMHDTDTSAQNYVTISPSVAIASTDKQKHIKRVRLSATPRLFDKCHEIFQCELRVVRESVILARVPLPYNLNVFSSCHNSSAMVITDFYPRLGKANADLWISGSGFLPSAVIIFGETMVQPSVCTQYMLRCKIPNLLMGMCPLYVMCGNDKSIAPAIFVFDALTNTDDCST